MTWTYTSTDPTGDDTSHVRLLIGDTSSSDQLLQDEEISGLAGQHGGVLYTAAACCDAVASKFARKVDMREGAFMGFFSQQADAYTDMAKQFRKQAALTGVVPYAGGISVGDKDAVESDTDRVEPSFRRDMFAHETQASSS